MTPIDKLGMGDRFQTFDLDRSMDYPGDRHSREGRNLYNVIDWTGQHRGQIALTPAERDAIQPLQPAAAAITSLIAERDGLREALAPFADFAEYLEVETEGFANTDELDLCVQESGFRLERFKIGDFRRARTALSLDTNKGDGE